MKNPAQKVEFRNPRQELLRINEKIAKTYELFPICAGYSEKERSERLECLYAKKRAILNGYPHLTC